MLNVFAVSRCPHNGFKLTLKTYFKTYFKKCLENFKQVRKLNSRVFKFVKMRGFNLMCLENMTKSVLLVSCLCFKCLFYISSNYKYTFSFHTHRLQTYTQTTKIHLLKRQHPIHSVLHLICLRFFFFFPFDYNFGTFLYQYMKAMDSL